MSYLLRHNASNGYAHGAPATPLIVTPFGTVLIRKDNINPLSSVKRVLIFDRCKILVWQGILYIYIFIYIYIYIYKKTSCTCNQVVNDTRNY